MSIYTNLSYVRMKGETERNARLNPETRIRAKRALENVSNEQSNAVKWYNETAEYWYRLDKGRPCSCSFQSIEEEKVKQEKQGISLQDFISSVRTGFDLGFTDFCPICFGSNFAGGYRKQGVDTIVFDATLPNKINNVSIVKDQPYYIKPSNKVGTITWKVFIPKYFDSVGDIAIKWKEEPANWTLKINNETFSKNLLESNKGNKVDFTIEIQDSTNEDAGLYAIFMQFNVSNPSVYVDLPRHTISYTGELNVKDEIQSAITINVDKTIKNPHTTDLIIDNTGHIWRITEVELGNPMGVLIYNTMQARLVRRFETHYLLPSRAVQEAYRNNIYTFVK